MKLYSEQARAIRKHLGLSTTLITSPKIREQRAFLTSVSETVAIVVDTSTIAACRQRVAAII